nr:MAG TPA: hypothetical protein [Caudoviricetes sp.]
MSNKRMKKTIHVFSNDEYMGNIMYTHSIPFFTEEELLDEILKHFPHLKGKRWYLKFS